MDSTKNTHDQTQIVYKDDNKGKKIILTSLSVINRFQITQKINDVGRPLTFVVFPGLLSLFASFLHF